MAKNVLSREAFQNFVGSKLSSEVHVRDWCDQIAGSNKLKAVMALSYRIWLEHIRDRHFSRIKLTYEISPRVVSENTALRIIEKFIGRGYLTKYSCHFEAGVHGIRPTEKFLTEFEIIISRMIRDFDQFGFIYMSERATRHDFLLWSLRNGTIVDAVGTNKWLGVSPKELIGTEIYNLFSEDWISIYGGIEALRKVSIDTYDQMLLDSRHVVVAPIFINKRTNTPVYTRLLLGLSKRPYKKKTVLVRRGLYEIIPQP